MAVLVAFNRNADLYILIGVYVIVRKTKISQSSIFLLRNPFRQIRGSLLSEIPTKLCAFLLIHVHITGLGHTCVSRGGLSRKLKAAPSPSQLSFPNWGTGSQPERIFHCGAGYFLWLCLAHTLGNFSNAVISTGGSCFCLNSLKHRTALCDFLPHCRRCLGEQLADRSALRALSRSLARDTLDISLSGGPLCRTCSSFVQRLLQHPK